MQKTSKEDRLKNIVHQGLERLQDQFSYKQSDITAKLKILGVQISAASLSNMVNGTRPVGLETWSQTAKGLQEILRLELDMAYDDKKHTFLLQNTPDWMPYTIPIRPEGEAENGGLKYHVNGRVTIQEKTAFIAEARKEVIEVGVRLHSFSSYFFSQNETMYKTHIIALLKKGVNIKSFLLDPVSKEAMLYFEDRAQAQTFEHHSIEEMKVVIERLKDVQREFQAMQLAGSFEIYLYKHIPFSQFLIVDGAEKAGKMMVAHYLYGVKRAECPVMEFTRTDQPVLYRKYWESVQLFLASARRPG